MNKKRILVDGYNLGLEQGTGIATYARNLIATLKSMGCEVTCLYDRRVKKGVNSDLINEIYFFDNEAWTMGHTWLQVTIDGETRDVCAGSLDNEPGKVNFEPLSPVHTGHPLTMFLTHLGLILFVGTLEWKALLTGKEPPAWAYEERNTQDH